MHFSITIVTLFTVSTAFLVINKHFLLFVSMVLFASFLRTNIFIPFLPFIIVAILLTGKNIFKDRTKIYFLLFILGVLSLNISSSKFDTEYNDWVTYHSAQASFLDYKGKDNQETFSDNEKTIAYSWYMQDSDLLATSKYIDAAPSLLVTMPQRLLNININNFTNHKYKYILIFLLLVTIFLLTQKRNLKSLMLYTFFILGIFLLLVLRDVDRTTVPLLFLWFVILTLEFLEKNQGRFFIFVYLLLSIYYFYPDFNKDTLIKTQKLRLEANALIVKSGISCEPSINFPTSWRGIDEIFENYQLFNESNWINYTNGTFLPFAWRSRHRYFYKTHNISSSEVHRKYKNYHEFLLDEKTGFIGGKTILNSNLSKAILTSYDIILLNNDRNSTCHHKAVIVAESEHFSISQIKIICKKPFTKVK